MGMGQHALLGKTFNGYEVTGVIGQGGMATVYKARQISMNRTVALKVLPRQFVDDQTYIQRFRREVEIVSTLEHRNIVPVYDYGEYERQPFIAMRYMPDGAVDGLLRDGPLSLSQTLDIIRQIAPALDYAHSKNVLHRDLKPSNVLLDDGGGAYLTDFGIARILGENAAGTITTQGVVGTPAYMSPEQAQGKPLDPRSDVYSLGVMLFEMLTGRRPFESETPYGVAVKQVTTPPPVPRSYNPDISPVVEQVLYKVLSKQPDKRYKSATALYQALQRAADNPMSHAETERPITHAQAPQVTQMHTPTPPPPTGFTNAPYGAPASRPASRPNQSAWMPPVPDAPRKRRGMGLFGGLMVGGLIGCLLLTGLFGGTWWLASSRGWLEADEADAPAQTETPIESYIATLDPTAEAERQNTLYGQAATVQLAFTPLASHTTMPTVTPYPTSTPAPVIVQTVAPAYTPTPAPIGVRPGM